MTSRGIYRAMLGFYLLLFFGYLFGPLLLMGATAFNASNYPQLLPWEGFTWQWFDKLLFNDPRIRESFLNSVIIGFGVVLIATPIGLAGAMIMTQIYHRARALYYLVVVSPLLTPGVIIGISTTLFWREISRSLGLGYDSVIYNGWFLTILGQSTFISAYCMLIFLSRLQRFDQAQEEAALDLGASNTQFFRQILLPYLRPAIFSAAALAFLSSFENFNTTTFTILSGTTLTMELGSRMRQGTEPSLGALGLLIILVTLVGAVIYEILRRREERQQFAREAAARAAERA